MTWQRWRRIPESGACDFCLMLASRGAVYKSQMTAAGRRYHRNCRCSAGIEGQADVKTDVEIPADDANDVIRKRVAGKNLTYRYVFNLPGALNGPPVARLPAMVKSAATGPWSGSTASGAVTGARLASVRLQLAQLRERLPTATETSREWIAGRISELAAEELFLTAAL